MNFDLKPDQSLTEARLSRSLLDIGLCYGGLAVSYMLIKVSYWFLPVTFLISANRLFALSLIAHEAVHFNLSRSKRLNDFFGRYLCAFPCFISLSKYRRLHLAHHRAVGEEKWDPDFAIYKPFPVSISGYIKQQLIDLVTFKTFRKHFDYYTEFPEFRSTHLARKKRRQLGSQSDFGRYVLYVIVLISVIATTGQLTEYLLVIMLPYLLIVQPWVLIVAGLQHGSDKPLAEPVYLRSRSIVDREWIVRAFLPLDINYHAEHHLAPHVPHYFLKRWSSVVRERDELWSQSFEAASREIFKTSDR